MSPTELVTTPKIPTKSLIDVAASAQASSGGVLKKVGMSHIEMPICLKGENDMVMQVPALIDAYVNLVDDEAKGIHMSRLFLAVQRNLTTQPLTKTSINNLLVEFLKSHSDLSDEAYVKISYDLMLLRPALISRNLGYRSYPVTIEARSKAGKITTALSVKVVYSSTCPCSAALARQLIKEQFQRDFADQETIAKSTMEEWLLKPESICATPHSQRSTATVTVHFDKDHVDLGVVGLIDLLESALKTPVQAAVKREDEQEFARLNGANLMFCEDAARRMKEALNTVEHYIDFSLEARHMESLHPHDAVAHASKFD